MDDVFALDNLRQSARVAGFEWSDAELELIAPAVRALLRLLASLDTVPLGSVEPTTQYRII